jgi:hypothetical protein
VLRSRPVRRARGEPVFAGLVVLVVFAGTVVIVCTSS